MFVDVGRCDRPAVVWPTMHPLQSVGRNPHAPGSRQPVMGIESIHMSEQVTDVHHSGCGHVEDGPPVQFTQRMEPKPHSSGYGHRGVDTASVQLSH
jgi:hypothetical protein